MGLQRLVQVTGFALTDNTAAIFVVLNVGDMVKVRVMEVDDKGRVNLTMKNLDKPFNPDDVPKRRPPSGRDNRHGDRRRSRH